MRFLCKDIEGEIAKFLTTEEITRKNLYRLFIRKSNYAPDDWNVCARYGRLDMIEWLHDNNVKGCAASVMDEAAESGHLDIVIFLNEYRTEKCTQWAIEGAAMNGHINVVQYLQRTVKSIDCSKRGIQLTIDLAIMHNHYDVVQFLNYRVKFSKKHSIDLAEAFNRFHIAAFIEYQKINEMK
jgi:hypothetical protein